MLAADPMPLVYVVMFIIGFVVIQKLYYYLKSKIGGK